MTPRKLLSPSRVCLIIAVVAFAIAYFSGSKFIQ